jgi:hypothetical protein
VVKWPVCRSVKVRFFGAYQLSGANLCWLFLLHLTLHSTNSKKMKQFISLNIVHIRALRNAYADVGKRQVQAGNLYLTV